MAKRQRSGCELDQPGLESGCRTQTGVWKVTVAGKVDFDLRTGTTGTDAGRQGGWHIIALGIEDRGPVRRLPRCRRGSRRDPSAWVRAGIPARESTLPDMGESVHSGQLIGHDAALAEDAVHQQSGSESANTPCSPLWGDGGAKCRPASKGSVKGDRLGCWLR